MQQLLLLFESDGTGQVHCATAGTWELSSCMRLGAAAGGADTLYVFMRGATGAASATDAGASWPQL
jgi:hypothetical protein